MGDLFSGPDIEYIESPSQEETDEEIEEQKRNERQALGAFFLTLSQGGADELRSPTTTGLNL